MSILSSFHSHTIPYLYSYHFIPILFHTYTLIISFPYCSIPILLGNYEFMIVQKVNKAAVSGEFWLSNDSDPTNLRELLAITYTVVSNINDMLLWRYYYHVAIDGRIHYLCYNFKTSSCKVSLKYIIFTRTCFENSHILSHC